MSDTVAEKTNFQNTNYQNNPSFDINLVGKPNEKTRGHTPKILKNFQAKPKVLDYSNAAKTVNRSWLARLKQTNPFISNYTQNLFKSKRELASYDNLPNEA